MKQIHRKFARVYPSHHPRKGEETFFVEKIVRSIHESGVRPWDVNAPFSEEMYHIVEGKGHTIRGGNHFKKGDFIIPSVWSGRPYNSPSMQFAPPIEIVNTWSFQINERGYVLDGDSLSVKDLKEVAKNDGLTVDDFECWFKLKKGETFEGQIICWDKKILY